LAAGEAEAAGEELAAGLGLLTGARSVAGELAVTGVGLAALGVFELVAGSQAAANASEHVATSSSTMRPIKLMFGLMPGFLIIFPSFQQD
jgi:hypothetical protein